MLQADVNHLEGQRPRLSMLQVGVYHPDRFGSGRRLTLQRWWIRMQIWRDSVPACPCCRRMYTTRSQSRPINLTGNRATGSARFRLDRATPPASPQSLSEPDCLPHMTTSLCNHAHSESANPSSLFAKVIGHPVRHVHDLYRFSNRQSSDVTRSCRAPANRRSGCGRAESCNSQPTNGQRLTTTDAGGHGRHRVREWNACVSCRS